MTNSSLSPQTLYSTIGTDPDFQELVELFVQEMPDRIQRILDHFQRGDREGLYRLTHQLKGSAGGYGFPPISLAAAQVVEALRNQYPEDYLRKTVEDLIALCQAARAGGPPDSRKSPS